MSTDLISQRPYLLRAMHEWMTDSGQTPQIVVDASVEGVDVPKQHIQDGKIVLNISYSAVQNLHLGNDQIDFEARFAGTPCQIRVPTSAVLGIYARETSQGMVFSEELAPEKAANTEKARKSGPDFSRPHLRIVE